MRRRQGGNAYQDFDAAQGYAAAAELLALDPGPLVAVALPEVRRGRHVVAAARALERSTAKLWRIETGQVAMRSHDVETMCRVYAAPDNITEALTGLARETKARGWWHAYGDAIPEWFGL
jgi:hypothetical protein